MIPEPAKAQPYVAREHSRESSRYGTATHMQRAHTYRGRRGSPRHRPRQLRLARHLVRAVRALQPSSGCRESSALLEAIRVKGSGRGHGRPRPEV